MTIDHTAGADAPNFANNVLRLSVARHATSPGGYQIDLRVAGHFAPYRKAWLDYYDFDVGAAGVALIPGTNYLVAGGKQGLIYLLDRQHLGDYDQAKAWTLQTALALAPKRITDCPECREHFTADRVVQKFQAAENQYIPRDLAHISTAGGGISAVVQDWDQPDVFTVGRDGALWVTSPLYHNPLDLSWHQPARITPLNLISPDARVAAARQNDEHDFSPNSNETTSS